VTETEVSPSRLRELFHKAKILKNDYSDKIPDQIVSGELKYKVQKNWFNAISLLLMRAAKRGELDDDFMEKYRRFNKRLSRLQSDLATKDDIKEGDKILDELMEYCRRKMEEVKKAA
jgi:hypothetical protein